MSSPILSIQPIRANGQVRSKSSVLVELMKSEEVSILIVDDEEPIRKLLASYLSADYTCVTAKNAEEAKNLLAASSFNLVLTDITMPGASGIELCEHINTAHPGTLVVIVSAKVGEPNFIGAERGHAVDFVAKPFDLSHVLKTVKSALAYQVKNNDD